MPRAAGPSSTLDQRLKYTVAGLTVGTFVALAVFTVVDLRDRRHLLLEEGERRASNLAMLLAEHLREAFAAADVTLRQLVVHSPQLGGPGGPAENWNPLLGVSRTRRNSLGSLSVTDAGGIIRHSTVPTLVGSSRRDTYIFKRLAALDRDLMVADAPMRAVTDSRIMLVPLGRRLADADGNFLGIVVATFTPSHLREFFSNVDVGPSGHIWVFHPEGAVLFHAPSINDPIGESAVGNPIFEHTRTLQESAQLRLPAREGAPSSLVALRSVGEPRLSVAVSLSETDLLDDWRRDVGIDCIVLAGAALGFALLLRFVFRQIDARAAAEQALVRSQRLDAIGQLTGGVAHDFNNLLTVIMMNVSLLKLSGQAGDPESPDAATVKQIEDAAKRAATLTQQLLSFARRQPLRPKRVDLNQLVADLQPMLNRVLGEDIVLHLLLSPVDAAADVDPVQLETALLNLCLNSRDAMPRGGQLRIETAAAAQLPRDDEFAPGDYVSLSVSDTGAGISPEHLPRIFEPFFTTKPVGRGTGLGLSMVYGFVQQSGGHVRVQSEVDRGTTVRLYFPIARARAPVPDEPAAPLPVVARGEVVLLVEDDAAVREVAALMLRQLGFTVVSANDGHEAVARARELPRIDLLLTDVVLPGGMDGREVAAALSRERPGLRVIFASGYPRDTLQRRTSLGSSSNLLAKPYTLDQLSVALRDSLRTRGS